MKHAIMMNTKTSCAERFFLVCRSNVQIWGGSLDLACVGREAQTNIAGLVMGLLRLLLSAGTCVVVHAVVMCASCCSCCGNDAPNFCRSLLMKVVRIPRFLAAIQAMPRRRSFWALHSSLYQRSGFWEAQVNGKWKETATGIARETMSVLRGREYLEKKYVETYRLGVASFNWLVSICRAEMAFESTNMRDSIPVEKRLAFALHWLAHGFAERQLANTYHVGPSHCEQHHSQRHGRPCQNIGSSGHQIP